MNKRALRWLYEELPELAAKGILTQETADKIRQHYGEIKTAGKTPFILIVCGVLGALFIGLGIILLFAHNWEQFSRPIRVVFSLALPGIGQGLALSVLWKWPRSSALKEGTATFLSLMVGASIALIAQTYHIPGDLGTFLLTWIFLIVPLVYLMQASLPAAVYLIGVTFWTGTQTGDPLKAILFWPLAAVIIPHFIWALRQEIYTLRTTILSLVIVLCASVAAGFSLGRTWSGSWVVIFPSLYAVFYFLGGQKFGNITTSWQRPWRLIGGIGLFVLAFQLTFRYVWRYLGHHSFAVEKRIFDISALPDHIVTLALIATALLLFRDNVRRGNWTLSLFGALPLLAIIGYLTTGRSIVLPLLIFNVYLFMLSIGHIALGIRNNSLAAVNRGMLMLAVLIMARFFDSNINFILKGLVFIIIGIGFLTVNVLLIRRRRVTK